MSAKIIENQLIFNGSFKNRPRTERIVIHHSASSLDTTIQDIHRWHLARNWIGIGYHYVIYADGDIYRGRPELAMGAHAYQDADHEANSNGLGICLIGNFDQQPPTGKQMDSLPELVLDIWKRYPSIPIIGHQDVMATACPGALFPWAELNAKLDKDVIKMTLEKWMIDGGQEALQDLSAKGLVNNPENWSTADKLAQAVPAYLFWMMIKRISEYKGS